MTTSPTTAKQKTRIAARLLTASGVSVIPILPSGAKAPALVTWKPFQAEIATGEQIKAWFTDERYGLAVVGGAVSGNLLIVDFETESAFFAWCQHVDDHDLRDLLTGLPITLTPKGGRHLFVRSDGPVGGNQKLAQRRPTDAEVEAGETRKAITLIETRGEGGYVLIPPSPPACHPANKPYMLLEGVLHKIPTLPAGDVKTLVSLARLLDELPPPDVFDTPPAPRFADNPDYESPGDAYNARGNWRELLMRHGWTQVRQQGEKVTWRRPGKASGISATENYANTGFFYVFSSSAAPLEPRSYRPFALYALLECGSDFRQATRELAAAGYGSPEPPPMPSVRVGNKKLMPDGTIVEKPDSGDEEALKKSRDENGLAKQWAKANESKFLYVQGKQWWGYEANRWRYCGDDTVQHSVQWFLDKRVKTLKPTFIRNVMFLTQSMIGPVSLDRFDARPDWIALRNGVYSLSDETLFPHDPKHLLTFQAPYDYDSEADCPLWKRCVQEWLLDERGKPCQDWIDLLQEWFGYCLIPDNTAQACMLWVGEGGNGKGVATRVLESMIGEEYTTALAIEQLHDPYHRADLLGKRVALVNEIDPKAMSKNATQFKAITGGDRISARRPNENVFSFFPVCRIVISTNELPTTKERNGGYWRRLFLIEWRNNIPKEQRDPYLDEKLKAELPGIFNWALEGLRRWEAQGRKFTESSESNNLLESYRRSQDSVALFIADQCLLGPDAWEVSSNLFRAYRTWCETAGLKPDNQHQFGLALSKRKLTDSVRRIGTKAVRTRCGITLNPENGEEDRDVTD